MSSGHPSRVVMMVANDVSVDTRVRKIALSVASTGLDVTVVGISPTDVEERSMLGPVQLIRVPVRGLYEDWVQSTSLRGGKTPVAIKHRMKIGRVRKKLKQRELRAALGRRSEDPSVRAKLERFAIRWINRFVGKYYGLGDKSLQKQFQKAAFSDPTSLRSQIGAMRVTRWRKLFPELHDLELAFGPVLDELAPDLIHAHDIHVIGIAERAVARAKADGRRAQWIYDAHEYIQGLARYSRAIVRGYSNLEQEYIGRADGVITVSEPLADLLEKDYSIDRPRVVLNIPIETEAAESSLSVRETIGIGPDVPLLVYSGGIDPARGVQTLVLAMASLSDVHVVLVVSKRNRNSPFVQELIQTANDGGYGERLHTAPFVSPDEVVQYLSSATVGIHPLSTGVMNHQIALPNKLFEYLHAGLPLVVSDNKAMKQFVDETSVGEVFADEDPVLLASAINKVLADVVKYERAIETSGVLTKYTWDAQASVLVGLYRDLLGDTVGTGSPVGSLSAARLSAFAPSPTLVGDQVRLGIGPRNSAGQAFRWARALEENFPGVVAGTSFALPSTRYNFPVDQVIPVDSWRSLRWQLQQIQTVTSSYSHLLLESFLGVLGTLNGGLLSGDLDFLENNGIKVAVVFHGSDIRHPDEHLRLEPFSPFGEAFPAFDKLRESVDRVQALLPSDLPIFYTTPDLSRFVPRGTWLPIVVEVDRWRHAGPIFQGAVPVVLHAPTSGPMKGSGFVDDVAKRLDEEGIITYRRVEGVDPGQMDAEIAGADVVVDGLVLGAYGVIAIEAMLSGKVVVGNESLLEGSAAAEVPIVQADPGSLEAVLRDIAARPAHYALLSEVGRNYALRYHDGMYSSRVLEQFLGLSP